MPCRWCGVRIAGIEEGTYFRSAIKFILSAEFGVGYPDRTISVPTEKGETMDDLISRAAVIAELEAFKMSLGDIVLRFVVDRVIDLVREVGCEKEKP